MKKDVNNHKKRMIPPPIPPKQVEPSKSSIDAPPIDAIARAQAKAKAAKIKAEESAKANQTKQTSSVKSQTIKPIREIGGPQGLEPTRYGDWEQAGRCFDF